MQIRVNTDERIHASEALRDRVRESVSAAVRRFSTRVSEVDVQVTQLDACTAGWFEQRCWIEVGLRGRQPMSVEHDSISLNMAVDGALQKLVHIIRVALQRSDRDVEDDAVTEQERANASGAWKAGAVAPSVHH